MEGNPRNGKGASPNSGVVSFILLEVIIYHFIRVNYFHKVEFISTATSIHYVCYRKVNRLYMHNA